VERSRNQGAWQEWGNILGPGDSNVYGSSKLAISQPFGNGGDGLFKNPPKCYMHNQASFITDNFVKQNAGVKAGTDFKFFPLPDVDPANQGSHVGAGDAFSMLKDTSSHALSSSTSPPRAQAIWVKRGGKLSPKQELRPGQLPDDITRQVAQVMTGAKIFAFDAGDLMPDAMKHAYWTAVLDFIRDQTKLTPSWRSSTQSKRPHTRRRRRS